LPRGYRMSSIYNKTTDIPKHRTPWSTADNTGRQTENNDPLITTFWDLLVRKYFSYCRRSLFYPKYSSFNSEQSVAQSQRPWLHQRNSNVQSYIFPDKLPKHKLSSTVINSWMTTKKTMLMVTDINVRLQML